MTQKQVRKVLLKVLKKYVLPLLEGKTVRTEEVRGHDDAVQNARGLITDIDLLEGEESSILLSVNFPEYGDACILLEELQ